MQISIEKIKSINKLSVIRSVSMVVATITMLVFYFDPVDFASNAYIMLLLWGIYWLLSGIYFYEQINLWKNVQRFRFLSWYYISFSIVGIIVLLALSIVAYVLFNNTLLSVVALVLFLIESIRLFLEYYISLHFIAVFPEYILLVKRKIQILYPENIAEIFYRNDILIFKLKNDSTVFINFLEINEANTVRQLLSEWLHKHFKEYQSIEIDLLKNMSL